MFRKKFFDSNGIGRGPRFTWLAGVLAASCGALSGCSSPADEVVTVGVTPELVYRTHHYFSGLRLNGDIVKTPTRAWVEFEDGRVMGLEDARAADRQARFARQGVLDDETYAFLLAAPQDVEQHVAIGFIAPLDAPNAGVATPPEDALARIRESGLRVSRVSTSLPIAEGDATPPVLLKAAHLSGLESLSISQPSRVIEESAEDPVPYTQADSVAWPQGFYGGGAQIGVLEPGACHINDKHPIFASSTIDYTDSGNDACTANAECKARCGDGSVCVLGRCEDYHGTGVAGVVAQVAPKATIVYSTQFGAYGDSTLAGMELSYSKFQDRNVRIVNQSFRIPGTGIPLGRSPVQGIVEDFAARRRDVLIVQSAGNGGTGNYGNEETCPYNLNAICVGSHDQDYKRSCFSDWNNPGGFFQWKSDFDREEPDLLAYGGNGGAVRDFCPATVRQDRISLPAVGSSATRLDSGTSYSAPAVAAGAALLYHKCQSNKLPIGSLLARAILMATAVRNPEGTRYSTAQEGANKSANDAIDWKDGAGVFELGNAFKYCEKEPPSPKDGVIIGSYTGIMDLNAGQDMWPASGESPYPGLPPDGTHTNGVKLLDRSITKPGINDTRKVVGLHADKLKNLRAGDKVRAVATWHGCNGNNTGPAKVGTDFDLILWNNTKNAPYYASQSNDDNNEGFDVDITPGNEGDYVLVMAWPKGAPGCSDRPGKEEFALVMRAVVQVPQ